MSSTIETISKQAQEYYRETPTIILGSGASSAHGLSGMGALSQHLVQDVSVSNLSGGERDSWRKFCNLISSGRDLETALQEIPLSQTLTENLVRSTWSHLVPQDYSVFLDSLNNPSYFALGKLIKHLFRSTRTEINIVTTNYDRLAEYACEQEDFHHFTGFTYGFRRNLSTKHRIKSDRQVNIWKVHGSLDWFNDQQGITRAFGNIQNIPEHHIPLIVTPGVEKYRITQKEPYKTIIHMSDDVLDESTTYLCIGFGFNDEHIQEKLVNRCARGDAKILVITHQLTEAAKSFLNRGSVQNFLAIECGDDDSKSIIHSSVLHGPEIIEGDFWKISGFLKLITDL